MTAGKGYTRFQTMLMIMTCGCAYTAIVYGSKLPMVFYNIFQEALGLTDGQVGMVLSVHGMVSLVGYLASGILTDVFGTKRLLLVAYLGSAAVLLGLTVLPPYGVVLVLTVLAACCAIVCFWGAMANFVRSLGPVESESERYGVLYMAAGISGAAVGLLGSALTSALDARAAVRVIYVVFAVIAVLAAVEVAALYHEPERAAGSRGIRPADILGLVRMPSFWLLVGAIFAGYLMNLAQTYYSPLLETAFGVATATATAISSLRAYVVRMVVSPLAGRLADRLRPSRVITIALVAMLAIMVALVAMPWDPSWAVAAIVLVFLTAIAYNLIAPTWLSGVSELGIPDYMHGTAVGFLDSLAFSSDAFMFGIFGGIVDTSGVAGYRTIYAILAVIAAGGLACNLAFRRRQARQLASGDAA